MSSRSPSSAQIEQRRPSRFEKSHGGMLAGYPRQANHPPPSVQNLGRRVVTSILRADARLLSREKSDNAGKSYATVCILTSSSHCLSLPLLLPRFLDRRGAPLH